MLQNTGNHWNKVSKARIEAVEKGVKYELFIKPGIQEPGTECGECREHGKCPQWFWGIY